MSTWFIFTLLSISVLAIAEISQKISMTKKEDISAEANNFVAWSIQGIFALIWFFLGSNTINTNDLDLEFGIKLLILATVYFIAGTAYYSSYKGNSISISLILVTISVIVSTTLGIIFFDEVSNVVKFLGVLLILSGIIFINLKKKERFEKYNLLALAGGIFYGIAYTVDKSFVINLDATTYQIFFGFSIAFVSLLFRGKLIIKDLKRANWGNYKMMFLSGVTFFFFNRFTFLAYENGGDVGRVDAINNASIFLVMIVDYFLLKQKTGIKRKLLAAILAFVGVLILGFTK
jgi:drug/metabolite transporter (DMT)-like permease